jgi:NAD(P)-dependent dehydrogenase (short-subunit alcohol dehydrogenase family)
MYLKQYDLSGRRALVTGGARGIGYACADALAEAGADIVIVDIEGEAAEAAARKLAEKSGRRVDAGLLDVTKPADVTALADRLAAEKPIDILVNNAGIALSGVGGEDTEDERWLKVIDVDLNGVFWCCRAFGRHMLAQRRGAIVNIGSMSGFISNKPQKQAYYNAAKAGVHHLTRSLAGEWAERGVRVNAVAPTYIETPLTKFGMDDKPMYDVWLEMTPMKRVGQPEEIASVVLFLSSDASSLLTGSIVLADAGYTVW